MIDERVLDEILPVPDREELVNEIQEELLEEGFTITNFTSGGVFYTLMMILIQIRIELVKLLREVLNSSFVRYAQGPWLELKAADFSKKRKQPTKTQGYITLKRPQVGEAIKIQKGHTFKTEQDINGEELRFFAKEDTIMQRDSKQVNILVEAESTGSIYNVPQGQVKKSLTHIEGIDEVINEVNWITKEGSDLEDVESLRERTLNAWAELSTLPIRDKYKNVCEGVPGVLFVKVDDLHPRGQGTVDIIVTSTAGVATQGLLDEVSLAADEIKGPYDNLLIKSSTIVTQNLDLLLLISKDDSDEGLIERVNAIAVNFFRIKKDRELNVLYKDDIIFALRKDIPILKSVKVKLPLEDVTLTNDKVIMLGTVNIEIQRV